MSAQQSMLRHNNQQLFSDHYLDALLPLSPDWQALAAAAAPARAEIARLLDAFTPSKSEAEVEQQLVRPILTLLGHTFAVQPALRTPDGTKRPDYLLYQDAAARDANANQTLTETLLAPGGLAVADAKYWDRPLDIALKGAGDPFTNKHPGFQIAFYIQHSGLAWGLLTNGRLWRLYGRDTAHKLDRFYEVDLPASRDYARGVGDTLKTQVYDALRHLAALVHAAYGLTPADLDLLWRTAPPRTPVGPDPAP